MSRVQKSFLTLSAAGFALAAAACSDTTTAPRSLRASDDASMAVVGVLPGIPAANATVIPIASTAATQWCGYANVTQTLPGTVFTGACVNSDNLDADLVAYNPGWGAAVPGSSWIGPILPANTPAVGPSGTANEYKALPGAYQFATAFNVTAGATGMLLRLTLRSDNAVIVYLNNVNVGQNTIADCPPPGAVCNWTSNILISDASAFVAGANTLRVDLIDTRIGQNVANPTYTCETGPPASAAGHFPAPFNSTLCASPAGVSFAGDVSFAPPVVTTWCSPGFWKNNGRDLWTQYYTKKYSTLAGAAPLGKKAPAGYDPTLLEVIDNPNIYGGEATNSVADFLSNKAFGTPIGSGVESCPGPGNVIVH